MSDEKKSNAEPVQRPPPLTGAQLAAKYGFRPHGDEPWRSWVGEALNRLRSGDEPDSAIPLLRQALEEQRTETPEPSMHALSALETIRMHASGECTHTAEEHMACFESIERLARAALEKGEAGR